MLVILHEKPGTTKSEDHHSQGKGIIMVTARYNKSIKESSEIGT